ncbi:hypothetical protein L1049_021659 [Liquidambar formosana]|uniref:IQ domain-containing protein IQM6-like n=1 Tax=Liquidambar formosana TaxID=63359 RepID=A0AAP0R300_LIQFO
MGISFSCPFADLDDLDSRFEAVLVRSVSFEGRDSEPAIMKSFGSGKMIIEGSLSFKGRELETMISFKAPSLDKDDKVFIRSVSFKGRDIGDQLPSSDSLSKENPTSKLSELGNHRYQAALKLQKVYKSFRTRRQLADCAVLVEQRWWKLLDFAELKRSSVSFFDIEKPETAVQRWSRARTRAAKVGKGLSKDEKARKLALQHWLEAIDPRHRYGHNLQFYYLKWLHCESKEPFFYWLDVGEGKEVNLERCSRTKLQQQCIKYLGPTERKAYEVAMENGKFLYKQTGKLLDTRGGPKDAKWIFVLSTSKTLYVGQKNKGTFQHSSFLAGGAALSAGRLVVEDGILKAVWPHSGHYLPTEENFEEFMWFLKEYNVDLTNVKRSPTDEEEGFLGRKKSGICLQNNQSEAELSHYTEETNAKSSAQKDTDSRKEDSNTAENPNLPMSRWSRELCLKISRLEIPKRSDALETFKKEEPLPGPSCSTYPPESPSDDGYETAEESLFSEHEFIVPKRNLFDEDQEEEDEKPIPEEKILSRINSHKGLKSYQLAKQLSSKWTTGAGPRIGCMRDYPSELQFRVLEQANLSPRAHSSPRNTSRFSPKVSTPTTLYRETNTGRSSLAPEQVISSPTEIP